MKKCNFPNDYKWLVRTNQPTNQPIQWWTLKPFISRDQCSPFQWCEKIYNFIKYLLSCSPVLVSSSLFEEAGIFPRENSAYDFSRILPPSLLHELYVLLLRSPYCTKFFFFAVCVCVWCVCVSVCLCPRAKFTHWLADLYRLIWLTSPLIIKLDPLSQLFIAIKPEDVSLDYLPT